MENERAAEDPAFDPHDAAIFRSTFSILNLISLAQWKGEKT